MSSQNTVLTAESKLRLSAECQKIRDRLDALPGNEALSGLDALEAQRGALELLRGLADRLAKAEGSDAAKALAAEVRDLSKDIRPALRNARAAAGLSGSTGKSKAKPPAFKPSTPAERAAAKARHAHNLACALAGLEAGAAFLPLAEKVPLAACFPQLDSDVTPEARAAAVAKAMAEGREPFAIGSTRKASTLKGWPAVNGELAFGISPGLVGALVVDCDDLDGAAFNAFLAQHGAALDLAHVPVTASGRGGRHYWFANPNGIGCGKLKSLCADLKGVGGQVVAPGMMLPPKADGEGRPTGDARHYQALPRSLDLWTALRDDTLPALPTCLAQLIAERPKGSTGKASTAEIQAAADALAAGPQPDMPERDVEAMAEALRAESPDFADLWDNGDPEGDRSNGRFNLARMMLERYTPHGFSVLDWRDLMGVWEHSGDFRDYDLSREYGKHISPVTLGSSGDGFSVVDLEAEAKEAAAEQAKISADKFAEARAALATADILGMSFPEFLALLDPKPAKPAAPAVELPPNRRPRYDAEIGLTPLDPVEFLVDGLLTRGEVVIADGAPGAGKSADLMHLGRCVAAGTPWHGRETARGGVLYVANENVGDDERRVLAHRIRYGDAPGLPFRLDPTETRLFLADGKTTTHEVRIIKDAMQMEADTGVACKLIIIDNLRVVMAPGDTAKEPEVTILMKSIQRIRNKTGATVILIAHTILDGSRLAGSGALSSMADSVWHLDAEIFEGTKRGKEGKTVKVKAEPACITFPKLRLGKRSQNIGYRIVVETGIVLDTKGREVPVAVAADLPSLRGAHGATDGEAFGAVDPSAEDGDAALGQWDGAGAAQASPESPTAPAAQDGGQDAPDARTEAIMEAARDMAAAGRPGSAPRLADAATAILQRRDRKATPISDRSANRTVARLMLEKRLMQVGAGKLVGYAPTAA